VRGVGPARPRPAARAALHSDGDGSPAHGDGGEATLTGVETAARCAGRRAGARGGGSGDGAARSESERRE
jgi:hypothetical protein